MLSKKDMRYTLIILIYFLAHVVRMFDLVTTFMETLMRVVGCLMSVEH